MLNVGDRVISIHHGAGRVVARQIEHMNGADREYAVIQIIDSAMEIMVPADTAPGVRAVSSPATIRKIIAQLGKPTGELPTRWNQRHKRNQELAKSTDILDLATVTRDLLRLADGGKASPAERTLLERALARLVGEIALASEISPEQARGRVMMATGLARDPVARVVIT